MSQIQVHLRNKLLAGAVAAIPLGATVATLWYVDMKTRLILRVESPYVGIAIAVLGLYLLGLFVTSLIGQSLLGATDSLLHRVPGARDLYRSWKQMALARERPAGIFARVVLVPDESGWMRVVGFTSGRPIDGDPGVCCVFVPAAPNPTSGRLYFVPTDSCIPVDVPPQEALKMIISGGNYVPAAIGAATAGQGPLTQPLSTKNRLR